MSFPNSSTEVLLAAIGEDVDLLEKACIKFAETYKQKEKVKEPNGIKAIRIEELVAKIQLLEGTVAEKDKTIDSLTRENENLKAELAHLKDHKPNGITQNGHPRKLSDSGIKDWQRESESLQETNLILETKIQGLVEELQKYQGKEKGLSDSILIQKEQKDFLTKLDDFDFLFRRDATSYKSDDLQPTDKLNKILEGVKVLMSHYFHFVVLAIKYDSMQAGNSKICNLDAAEMYEQAQTSNIFHGDWPLFILSRLNNRPPPTPSGVRRSLLISSSASSSGYFGTQPKRVTFSPQVTTTHFSQ